VLHDLRTRRWWLIAATAVAVAGFQVIAGIPNITSTMLTDRFDVFSGMMNSPTVLVAPLAGIVGAGRLSREIGARFVVSARMRAPVGRYLLAKIGAGCVVAALIVLPLPVVAYVTAYLVWPALGDPNVDLISEGLTPAAALAEAVADTSYSQLLAVSPEFYVTAYTLWLAFSTAVFCALGMAMLLIVRNRALAVVIPFLLYLTQDVLIQFAGNPTGALLHSIFPFGLQQSPILVAATPVLVLATGVTALWVVLVRNARRLPRLS
jgi:hypothetical protein